MRSKIKANLYTLRPTPTLKHYGEIMPEDKNGYLFSQGRYRTKIKAEDLPEYYIPGTYYRTPGFLSAKGVKQMVYKPNFWINHLFKDDYLYISYDKEIKQMDTGNGIVDYVGSDILLWGWSIIDFLKGVEKYSNYDISEIKKQIEFKRQTLKENHPEAYRVEGGESSTLIDFLRQ